MLEPGRPDGIGVEGGGLDGAEVEGGWPDGAEVEGGWPDAVGVEGGGPDGAEVEGGWPDAISVEICCTYAPRESSGLDWAGFTAWLSWRLLDSSAKAISVWISWRLVKSREKCQPTVAEKRALKFWKWRPYKVRSLVSNSIDAKKDRNGPPSANQVTSKHQPRRGHAVCTLRVHPPTSPCPTLSAHAEPISWSHCRKWHHEAESLMTPICAIGPKGLMTSVHACALHICRIK